MTTKKCCVPECTTGKSHRTLHLFPNPLKDKERFNEWIMAIGGDILALNNDDIYKYRRVCHTHFEEKYCCRLNRISNIAVPTLNMPSALPTLPIQSFVERRPMREIQNVSMVNPPPLPDSSTLAASARDCEGAEGPNTTELAGTSGSWTAVRNVGRVSISKPTRKKYITSTEYKLKQKKKKYILN